MELGGLQSSCWSWVELSFPARGIWNRTRMGLGVWNCFLALALLFHFSIVSAQTDPGDADALHSIASIWKDKLSDWVGLDPCSSSWVGINCNNSRVTSLRLSSMGLTGNFPGDILSLTELLELDLSYNPNLIGPLPMSIGRSLTKIATLILVGCNFSGPIPDLSPMKGLYFLSLNSNRFTGEIPPSFGTLSNVYWLDVSDNQLTGTIPVSNGNTSGLDMLVNTQHFHFSNNMLSGPIPDRLFHSGMTKLIHVLFDGNKLTGEIPYTLGLVNSLTVLRLDRNALSGSVPSNINNLTNVTEMYLSNNKLTGPLPNLTGMSLLRQVDLSNNSFKLSDFPSWSSTLRSLTTLVMENSGIGNQVPLELFTLPQLQSVRLRNNKINGTLELGTNHSNHLQLVDLQNNDIESFIGRQGYDKDLRLSKNPLCSHGENLNSDFCKEQLDSAPSYPIQQPDCGLASCPSDQQLSPKCQCAYPYLGTLYFKAPSFSDIKNANYSLFQDELLQCFQTGENCYSVEKLPVDSVVFTHAFLNSDNYLQVALQVFPKGKTHFSQSEVFSIGFLLSSAALPPPDIFGAYTFMGYVYDVFRGAAQSSRPNRLPVIIGASVGGFALVLVLIGLASYAMRSKRRADDKVSGQNRPFAHWDSTKSRCDVPQLKGPRCFTFDELKHCTNNFSETNYIGCGGYGKVYRGILPTGQLIAIKRSQHGSNQGGLEFKTELELLSRVHHNNLVSLVGFCFDQDEQMLVYEYIPNGSLKESLTGQSGVRLDWKRRLRVALGAARGLAYLHEHASPPIIHRDVKSGNILLDDRLNPKVADFGLSKPMDDDDKDHATTVVKGTMGYMDPEYYMSQQLTEKSDVYSFGVMMLEMLTARKPIEKGRYVVREVKVLTDKTKDLYGLQELLDPAISCTGRSLVGFERYVELALACVAEAGADRPTMSDVAREIEAILQLTGINPNVDHSTSSVSASYEASTGSVGTGTGERDHPYSGNHGRTSFDYSGGAPLVKIEPK